MGSEPEDKTEKVRANARVAASSTTDQKTHTRQGERRGATVGSPGLTVHAAGAPAPVVTPVVTLGSSFGHRVADLVQHGAVHFGLELLVVVHLRHVVLRHLE